MNTKSVPSAQAQAQHLVSGWQPMASAPHADPSACIDIWCAEDECRRTDCFPGLAGTWLYETFDSATNGYHHTLVRRPVAWMPTPVKPEGL